MVANETKNPEEKVDIDLEEIIEKGKQGKLMDNDLDRAVEEIDLDKLYDTLESNGI